MATVHDDVPAPPVPAIGGGWVLRPAAEPVGSPVHAASRTRAFAASLDGGPEIALRIHHVLRHPLRACYPFGAHDLAVDLDLPEPSPPGPTPAPDPASALLRELVPALFAATPDCRRVIAAPDEHDTRAQDVLKAGGFRRITEADLPDRSVVLFAAEPPGIAGLSTALDDMPH
ncbi:GNAT family N-acetyltransferase [Streptomyces europaeiscabiei]|uniref:GNAT family N-acetyltransferase n=1 Tax=Streptomyces europaeiscabiei TaxID=146819 RepID=UPI002E159CE4|nr:acetyltransferase [Streptomyces europaeiscabiei]